MKYFIMFFVLCVMLTSCDESFMNDSPKPTDNKTGITTMIPSTSRSGIMMMSASVASPSIFTVTVDKNVVSGQITSMGNPLANISINLYNVMCSDEVLVSTSISNNAGNYKFINVEKGKYIVIPVLEGVDPKMIRVEVIEVLVIPPPVVDNESRKIFGLIGSSVKDDGQVQNPTPNIAVDLFDSDSKLIGEATTDGEGYYEFLMLDDGKYTVIPKPNGYVFDPTQAIVDIIGVD